MALKPFPNGSDPQERGRFLLHFQGLEFPNPYKGDEIAVIRLRIVASIGGNGKLCEHVPDDFRSLVYHTSNPVALAKLRSFMMAAADWNESTLDEQQEDEFLRIATGRHVVGETFEMPTLRGSLFGAHWYSHCGHWDCFQHEDIYQACRAWRKGETE